MAQTFKYDDSGLKAYLNDLAAAITIKVAKDPDVVLSNGAMEGRSTIAIESWDDVRETVSDALRVWVSNMLNRSVLQYPIPYPIYSILYLIIEKKCVDQRGTVAFVPNLGGDFLPSHVDEGFQRALFGDGGYFFTKWGHYSGLSYLRNGKLIAPNLLLAKEGNLAKTKDSPIQVEVRAINAGKVPLQVVSQGEVKLVFGQDGYDPEAAGLHHIIPVVDVDNQDSDFVEGRLNVGKFGTNADIDRRTRALLAMQWAFADAGPSFLRDILSYKVSERLALDLQVTVLLAEQSTAAGDLGGELPKLPLIDATTDMICSALVYMNPNLTTDVKSSIWGKDDFYRKIHTFGTMFKTAISTLTLAESLRAHAHRLLTYGKAYSGLILAYPEWDLTDAGSIYYSKTGEHASDRIFGQSTNNMAFTNAKWRRVLTAYPIISFSPMVSLDYNRVPISIKYCLSVVTNIADDNTGTHDLQGEPVDVTGGTMFRLLQRAVNVNDEQPLRDCFGAFTRNTGIKQIVDAIAVLKNTKMPVDQFEPSKSGEFASVIAVLGDALNEMDTFKDHGTMESNRFHYVFTKFEESTLIQAAGTLQNAMHFPYIEASGKHHLTSLGYTKLGKALRSNQCVVGSANLMDKTSKTARTEQGVALRSLSRQGGFGFASLLGPLIGEVAGAIGDLTGVPEIGVVGKTIGNVASLIPI